MNKNSEFEEELRTIANHPLRAMGSVHLGMIDMINDNGEMMVSALKIMLTGICLMLKSAGVFAQGLMIMTKCILFAGWHIFMLAFYPVIKLYYILRVRRGLRRDHPEYVAGD